MTANPGEGLITWASITSNERARADVLGRRLRAALRAAPPLAAIFVGLRLTRWSCNPARVRFPSASVRPTVRAEHSVVLLPSSLTSCERIMPSLRVNSAMTRHFIPLPPSAVISLTHNPPV